MTSLNIPKPGLGLIQHKRRDAVMITALIHHPSKGLIFFDVGNSEDIKVWHPSIAESTPLAWTESFHDLPSAIASTGAGTFQNVEAVVLSHLHFDHAGGLKHFTGTDVEIWIHEELKYAFWASTTKIRRRFLTPSTFNWKTFQQASFNIFPIITLYHVPSTPLAA